MMTDTEIAKSFANREGTAQSQLRILSELCCVPKETIKDILLAQGFTPEEINTRGHYKKRKQEKKEGKMAMANNAKVGKDGGVTEAAANVEGIPAVPKMPKMPELVKDVLKAQIGLLQDEIQKLERQKDEIWDYLSAVEAAEAAEGTEAAT